MQNKRIVVKVGTSTLSHPSGLLNIRRVEELCKVLSDLKNAGNEIILVSSGAIGMGVGKLSLPKRPEDMPTKQAAAAVGQCELMYTYDKAFGEYNHTVAQILLTAEEVDQPDRFRNFHNTMVRLLELHALPIINENDTMATEEIKIGDNDTLAARVAVSIEADLLILLSDIDGLYTADPRTHPDAELISDIPALTDEIIALAGGAGSSLGTGGMATKLQAATLATAQVAGYTVKAVTSVDNRGLTLPVEPDTGKTTESGYPIGNNVTCNLELRQAIAYAIDRQQVAMAALNGFGSPCYSENDGMPWNNPEVALETDVEYAKKLLADGGWADTDGDGIVEKDGIKAEFTCLYGSGDSVRQAVAMAAAEQLRGVGIQMNVEGTSWDDISKRMFSNAVLMGWGAANPYESYCLYHSSYALRDDYYNPEGYSSPVTDSYLEAAMEALDTETAYQNWKLAQWDGSTGTSMKGQCPWVWIVNVQHVYYVRDGLDIGPQQLHPHGASMPLLKNLKDWTWTA